MDDRANASTRQAAGREWGVRPRDADDTGCFFAGRGPCDGALVRAHLVPRALLKREFRFGVLFEDGRWRKAGRYEDRYELAHRSADELSEDPRSWVMCCGGPQGNGGHHGQLDHSRTLSIARHELPAAVKEFAAELGLTWWIEREYPNERTHHGDSRR